jgi:murein DD-endopeptidase MepM/ murein hydrolase activator NlpD
VNRRRRPDASLLLIGIALVAVIALETLPTGGSRSSAANVFASEGYADGSDTPGAATSRRRVPGTGITAGVLGGRSGAAPDGRGEPTPGAGDPPRIVRDGWAGTAVAAWERRGAPAAMSSVGELDLVLVAPVADPILIGFHEASTATGREMRPLGELIANDNSTRFTPPFEIRDGAQPYLVLASRGRSAGPTTAVDVVARPDAPVVAPITGQVTDIRSYALYGSYPDHRIEIRSTVDPSLRVVMVHLTDVTVAVGDRVIAGTSVVAERATLFPFSSQIDRETEPDRFPHVHVEVQAFDARRPGDGPEKENGS